MKGAPRLRVLVVAGAQSDSEFALRVLEDNGDRAEACADVPEALARLSQEMFDLALVSMSMPRGDGLALVHHLRALYPDLDVVAMSAADEVEEAASAMALGVLCTMVTPLTGDEILVAADRARERRMLIAERLKLKAKVASSARRNETFARCAAFVAESDPITMGRRVLEACAAEVESTARALYLLEAGQDRMFRLAIDGDPKALPEQINVRETHVKKGEVIGHVGTELNVLLSSGETVIGLIAVRRPHGESLPLESYELLEVVARLASASLTAARRVDAIARGGIKDPETGAYTFAYFGDVAAREIDRAVRHHREFALLTLGIPGVSALAQRASQVELSALRRAVTQGVLAAVRDSDVVARIDDDEYYLLLPETGLLGALACRRRILERLKRLPQDLEQTASGLAANIEVTKLQASVGVSVFPADGADLGLLLKLSRRRAERARQSEWHALGLEGRPFWESADRLLSGDADDPTGSGIGARASMPAELINRIALSLIRDADKNRIAGTLYLAGDPDLSAAVARAVMSARDLALRTWLLGPSQSLRDPAAEIRLPLSDARLKSTSLILCITERGGYCLVAKRSDRGEVQAYHSSDLELVEGLVNALQTTYHLQPELR
jgi:diguanylate cyclase (GGDEF)-like protein